VSGCGLKETEISTAAWVHVAQSGLCSFLLCNEVQMTYTSSIGCVHQVFAWPNSISLCCSQILASLSFALDFVLQNTTPVPYLVLIAIPYIYCRDRPITIPHTSSHLGDRSFTVTEHSEQCTSAL